MHLLISLYAPSLGLSPLGSPRPGMSASLRDAGDPERRADLAAGRCVGGPRGSPGFPGDLHGDTKRSGAHGIMGKA